MSILDIARSGLLSYRSALSVTAENIANVNTEGYVRRETVLAQVPGGQIGPTSAATSGQGVRVEDVRRAFDGLVAQRLRTAEGAAASAETLDTTAGALESLFLAGAGSVPEALTGFFDALNGLGATPRDGALRQVVLAAGQTLASSFTTVASGLAGLRDEVAGLAGQTAAEASQTLRQLAELNGRMTGAQQSALNPLLDERDRLLGELSRTVGVQASFDALGRTTVTLGSAPGGPLLLEGTAASTLGVAEAGGLVLEVTRAGATLQSRQITGGSLQGYASALSAVDNAGAELDALARQLVAEMNTVHAQGIDQAGARGGDLFALEGWQVAADAGNRGTGGASVVAFDTATAPGPLTLLHDAAAGLWHAYDAGGTLLGSGAETLALPGLTLQMTGAAMDGDRLTVSPRQGRALDMRFLLADTRQIAAAAPYIVSAASGNAGSAQASFVPVTSTLPATGSLGGLLTDAGGADAATLIRAGVVGHIPAGTGSVTLASLGSQSQQEFLLSDPAAAGATTLSFSIGSTIHSFDLTALGATDPATLAAALNAGAVSTGGLSLADLGVTASGSTGRFTLMLGQGDFDAGASVTGSAGTVAGSLTAAEPAGGTIQIITRDGRHIAGAALTAEEAALLLTEANGFLPGAVYDASTLNGAGGTGYRGTGIAGAILPGERVLSLHPADPVAGSSGLLPPASALPSLTLEAAGGLPLPVQLPAGASAAEMAQAINAFGAGIEAEARTGVTIEAPADGTLNFALTGTNLSPVRISGAVAGGRMDALALAVNAVSAATGVRAELSPDGARLLLVQVGGADIGIVGLRHTAGAAVTLQGTDAEGSPSGAPLTLSGTADSARFTGELRLSSASGFSADLGGVRQDAAVDPMSGGLVSRGVSGAGGVQTYGFTYDPAFDGAGLSADGTFAQAGSAQYAMTVGSRTVTLDAAAAGVSDGAGVASALAALLRAEAPAATLTGGPVAALPADGRSVSVSYEGQSYTLRMTGGAVAVEGGEPGVLTAAFDATNRLVIRAAGSLDGAGLRIESGAAAAFGLAAADAPVSTLTGQPADPAALPASFDIELGGTLYSLTASAGGIAVPAGFPGSAGWDGAGRLVLEVPAAAGALRVPPQAGARAAGLATEGVSVAVSQGALVLTSTTGAPVAALAEAQALAGQRLTLTDLPDEDLIVVMTGTGTLRLAGSLDEAPPSPTPAAVELRVIDAASRQVELFDTATGHSIGSRTLGADGSVTVGGYRITLTGTLATGDRFTLTPATGNSGGGEILDRLVALASGDPATGQGGYGADYMQLQTRIGTQAKAAAGRVSSTAAALEVAERASAAASAVNLDEEAARLIEQQQAYQASSQVFSVAQTLFETLLNAL
ncbi:flagellar hook-associated protein FlgK [Cereibacter sphaeroides]|uniref:flagellar hook-associated protein FlgK n=1 Tax=Cereibacter sphaeroides TaxID=1063 RepID=UPI00399078DA